MSEYYDEVILGLNGVVYAKGEAYKRLLRLLSDKDQAPTDYQPIYEVHGEAVPSLREILWINSYTYVGITTDGDLFSFLNGDNVHLESPIVSAYVGDSYTERLLVVLLENGRLRVVYVDIRGSLLNVNRSDIDQEIPQDIVLLSPVNNNPTFDSTRKAGVQYSRFFLAVTTDNEVAMIMIDYQREEDNEGITIYPQVDDPYKAYLRIIDYIDNNLNLDYRDIKMIRSGYILLNDGRIYNVTRDVDDLFILQEYNHKANDVIDLLIQANQSPVLLSESGSVYYEDRIIYQSTDTDKPIKFLHHYHINEGERHITYDKSIIVQGLDGGIYKIDLNGNTTEILPANNMLSYMGRTTKPHRPAVH